MALMQGNDNIFWTILAFALMIASVIGTWYMVVVGRDRPRRKQNRGVSTVARYGEIEEDRAPMPRFLTITIIGSVLWAIIYAIWTGINGLGT